MDIKDLEWQEGMARAQVRKMEREGGLPKMTTCTIKVDSESSIPVIRILVRRLPVENIHPVAKLFLVPMAVSRIRFSVERHSGVSIAVTCAAHPDVYAPGEFDEATRLVMEHPELRIAVRLTPLNEEFMEDMTGNPQYIQSFSRLAQMVEERVQEVLAILGVTPANGSA